MLFADLDLSRRLERTEGQTCREFAMARSRLFPEVGAAWIEHAGTHAMFDGVDSPVTQTFGLGLFEELTTDTLDVIERFFFDRGAAVVHEVSPLAGAAALELLCERGYMPIELSTVMYQPLVLQQANMEGPASVRIAQTEEAALWASISAQGWAADYPELVASIQQFGSLAFTSEHSTCFLAELDGKPGAAGVLSIHDGVALFGGASTIPEMRVRGLQTALLGARMQYSIHHGCDLAMMVTAVGSQSQRNAERAGFRIAYTRTKWRMALSKNQG